MPCSGFDLCIKCNTGGKTLVCKGDNCPIVVHENCMGCNPSFDVEGKFDCPYCLSRKAYVELNEGREAVMLTKRALSAFIDAKIMDSDNHNRKTKSSLGVAMDEREGDEGEGGFEFRSEQNYVSANRQGNGEDEGCIRDVSTNRQGNGEDEGCIRGDHLRDLSGEQTREGVKEDSKSSQENENRDLSGGGGSNEPILRKSKRIKPIRTSEPPSSNNDCSRRSSPMGKSPRKTRISIDPSKDDSPCEPPSPNVDCTGRSSPRIRKSLRKTNQTIAPSIVKSASQPSSPNIDCSGRSSPIIRKGLRKTKNTNFAGQVREKVLNPGGRKRLLWTEEEEEMIKKGVEKYTSEDNKNIPWRNILEFGRHVFQSSRQPHHLKDKWRTMLAKDNSAR